MIIDISEQNKEQLIESVLRVKPKYVIFKNPLVHSVSITLTPTDEWKGWKKDKLKELRCSQLEKVYNFCINPNYHEKV